MVVISSWAGFKDVAQLEREMLLDDIINKHGALTPCTFTAGSASQKVGSIKPALGQCHVFDGISQSHIPHLLINRI